MGHFNHWKIRLPARLNNTNKLILYSRHCGHQGSTAQCSTVQHNTVHNSTAQHSTYRTAQYSIEQHSTTQCSTVHTVQHRTVQNSTAQHNTYSTVQNTTEQHSTAQCSTVEHNTAQYSTVQLSSSELILTLSWNITKAFDSYFIPINTLANDNTSISYFFHLSIICVMVGWVAWNHHWVWLRHALVRRGGGWTVPGPDAIITLPSTCWLLKAWY